MVWISSRPAARPCWYDENKGAKLVGYSTFPSLPRATLHCRQYLVPAGLDWLDTYNDRGPLGILRGRQRPSGLNAEL